MSLVKLDNSLSQQAKRFDRVVSLRGAFRVVQALASTQLLLTVFEVALRLLELTDCDFIEAHADEVVGVNLGDGVGFLDKLEPTLAVELALLGIMLVFSQVQLVASEHVHGSDPHLLVFEEMTLLLAVIDAFGVERVAQDFGESLNVVGSVVHQLIRSAICISQDLQQSRASTQWVPFHWPTIGAACRHQWEAILDGPQRNRR